MKKFKISLPVIAVVLAIAASAFTANPVHSKKQDPMYYWFAPNGTYLGHRTTQQQDDLCPGTGHVCANGYTSKTAEDEPAGTFIGSVQKT